ncbi:nuclear transport factor 2 family protein [Halioglobus japonicus]|nr:nuclear transport factor 2 family protein [Halioglobus japonicus]
MNNTKKDIHMDVEQRLQALETELGRLSAMEEIRQLKARYLNACDRQDPGAVRDCFAEGEVIIDMSYFGHCANRDEFVDGIFIPRGCHDYVLDMHHCANPEIAIVDAERATGVWSLNYRNINTNDQTVTMISALYHDEYRRVDGLWKIARSRTEYRTALHLLYEPGSLQLQTAARTLMG